MGMYTELHFNARLVANVPVEVVAALQAMLTPDADYEPTIDHPLFKTTRWWVMLRMGSCSFAADTHSTLRFDNTFGHYVLCIRCNVKNYDQEIEHFVDWITPYTDTYPGEFLGFSRYESSEQPELIHRPKVQS